MNYYFTRTVMKNTYKYSSCTSLNTNSTGWRSCLIYMEKQPLTFLPETPTTAGAVRSMETDSNLLRAEGRGRFSGTMFSNEFACHCGHLLLSLHLIATFPSLPPTPRSSSAKIVPLSSTPKPAVDPIIMHATPVKHLLLHELRSQRKRLVVH